MAIDRVGKGGGGVELPKGGDVDSAKAGRAEGADRAFEVRPGEARGAAEVGQTAPATPLERVRAGELDVNGYVDLKVEEATAHLKGLSRAKLDTIRTALRAQLATDPALVDLVRQATGSVASAPGGDE